MADRRSKGDKLRELYHHPSTPPNERAAAKLALERLGEPLVQPRAYTSPRPGTRFTTGDFDMGEWLRQMFDQESAYHQEQERTRAYQQTMRDMARNVKAEAERRERQRRESAFEQRKQQVRSDTFCPSCMHNVEHHTGPRCYACHPNFRIEASERRAAWCGRIPFELGKDAISFHIEWGEFEGVPIYFSHRKET